MATDRPLVSVLMPVRNGAPWLEACLRSIRRQTLTAFEAVAVDDGSTDGSGELLERWTAGDSRFQVLHTPPRGLVAALNEGLAACRAPLVARMDADDAMHPRRLELQAAAMKAHPETGVVSCLVRHVPVHRVDEGLRRYEAWLNGLLGHEAMMRERFVESPVAHPSVMVRRRLLEEAGGWRDLGWPEDHDLWLRLAARGVRFAKVPATLLFWRQHPDRLTWSDPRYGKAAFLRLKAHHLARGPLAGGRVAIVWGAGPTGRRLARALEAEGVPVEAFVDIDPRLAGRSRRGRPILHPEALPARLGPGVVVLAAVAARGAREAIRARLLALGLAEGEGFWCVA